MNNYRQCYICGDSISIGTTCDNCWQKELDRKKDRENRPKLIPRSFKIEQNINEHTYFVEFDYNSKKWAVVYVNGAIERYLLEKDRFGNYYPDVVFDTPELALEAWTKWYSSTQYDYNEYNYNEYTIE